MMIYSRHTHICAIPRSQPHKHMQLLPLEMLDDGPQPPIKSAFDEIKDRKAGQIYTLDKLPFIHVITPLDRNFIDSSTDKEETEDYLAQMFFGLLDAMFQQLRKHTSPGSEMSYNFIMTGQFMMLVPRAKEMALIQDADGRPAYVSVNSLGFAGMLLVKAPEELKALETYEPGLLNLLAEVGIRWSDNPEEMVDAT